tara:strand:- start:306 stop:926 length:621 start_codon:yes stop_codon:yes gene_type:complete
MSVAGDGSCFFHSLSQILILEGNPLPRTTLSNKLRKQCVDWLEDNLEYRIKGIGLTIKDEIEEEIRTNDKLKSVDGYLTYMRKRTSYAGQIEIYAMANLFNRNIRVYIRNKGKFSNVGLGYQINHKMDLMKDIFIYHNMGTTLSPGLHHFEPLYPKVKARKESLKKKESKKRTSKKKSMRKRSRKPLKEKRTKRKKRQRERKTRRK